jgi:hypothetical protein
MVNDMNKIFVCLYREDQSYIVSDVYQPILAGQSSSSNPDFLVDGVGENIHDKNEQFGELTSIYWIWKNQISSLNIVGHCHYRRFFWTNKKQFLIPVSYSKLKFENSRSNFQVDAAELLGNHDIVLPPITLLKNSVSKQYSEYHSTDDLDRMRNLLSNSNPESVVIWDQIMQSNRVYLKLIFIMRKEVFDAYCSWIFPLLLQFNQRNKETRDSYQRRVEAFLAERMTLLFVLQNNLKVKEVPYVFISCKTKYVPYFWFSVQKHYNHFIFWLRNVC